MPIRQFENPRVHEDSFHAASLRNAEACGSGMLAERTVLAREIPSTSVGDHEEIEVDVDRVVAFHLF